MDPDGTVDTHSSIVGKETLQEPIQTMLKRFLRHTRIRQAQSVAVLNNAD